MIETGGSYGCLTDDKCEVQTSIKTVTAGFYYDNLLLRQIKMYRIRVDGLEQEFWRLLEDLVLLYEELLLEVLKCLSVCKRVSEGSSA